MVATLTYRTTDNSRWGGGQGSDLSATAIDLNFWNLFSAVNTLEDNFSVGAGIDFINQPAGGNLFFIHLTDHRVLGPFTIPTAQWRPRGDWAPATSYAAYDVVANDGSLYLIVIPHTSASTFSAFATDGMGHDLYNLLLDQPPDELPAGGASGQRLIKSTSSPYSTEWGYDTRVMYMFVDGQPSPSEMLIQFPVTDHMTLPQGLVGSAFFQGTVTASAVEYDLFKNGSFIGSINFSGPSPETITVSFPSDIAFVPGDILSLIGPSAPDSAQANISFSLVARITL